MAGKKSVMSGNDMDDFEERKREVGMLNLIDDVFFEQVMKDKQASGVVVSTILGKHVTVIDSRTQYEIRNVLGRSVRLDLIVQDDKGKFYNIEMQNGEFSDDLEKRMEVNIALMIAGFLRKGKKCRELPETYCIFITNFDNFKTGKVLNEPQTFINGDKNRPYGMGGIHRMYVNTEVDDGSVLSELMKYFKKTTVGNKQFGYLSKYVDMCKTSKKEVRQVSEWLRERIDQGKIETKLDIVEEMLADNMSLEKALKFVKWDLDTYKAYKEEYGNED